jgi:hypothetical protein
MATKHFVIDPTGKKHTRTSQNRVYAFAVIVRDGYEQALARAKSSASDAQLRKNYAYYVALANGTHEHCKFSDGPRYIAEAKQKIAGINSADEYIANVKATAVAAVEKAKTDGKYESYGVHSWCGRYDLAQKVVKAARAINHFDVIEIVEAQTE